MASVIRRPSYWLPIVALIFISLNASLLSGYLSQHEPAAKPSLERDALTVAPTAVATRVVVTPTTAPTASDYDAILRDTKRQLDLTAIQDALQSYQVAHGVFPSTDGRAQTLCEREGDAGCALLIASPSLSVEDNLSFSYWYVSDGQEFIVYAPAETVAFGCTTERLPGWLANGTFYCVMSQGAMQ